MSRTEPILHRATLHATAFLRRNAAWTTHTLMSPRLSDAERSSIIAATSVDGYGCIYIYAANEGDYGRRSVLYQSRAKPAWRMWLGHCIRAGLSPIIWFRADDSPGLNKWPARKWGAFIRDVVEGLGDLVAEYVVGLEVDEYWSARNVAAFISELRRRTTRRIGVHTTGLRAARYADPADVFYLQTPIGLTESALAGQVQRAIALWAGAKPVIAAEYHRSGETPEAHALGDAAIAAGAAGVGCGCSAEGLDMLRARLIGGLDPC